MNSLDVQVCRKIVTMDPIAQNESLEFSEWDLSSENTSWNANIEMKSSKASSSLLPSILPCFFPLTPSLFASNLQSRCKSAALSFCSFPCLLAAGPLSCSPWQMIMNSHSKTLTKNLIDLFYKLFWSWYLLTTTTKKSS